MLGNRLEFSQFGYFNYFSVCRSLTPMDPTNLPIPIATELTTMYYFDSDVLGMLDRNLYYRVLVHRDDEVLVSDEVMIYINSFSEPQHLTTTFDHTNLEFTSTWDVDGSPTEQYYYCSETTFTAETKPSPKAILAGDVRAHTDTAIEVGKTYYLAVGAVRNSIEKLSDIKIVRTGGDKYWTNVVSLLRFENGIIDDTGRIWNMVGSPIVENGRLVLNGSSGLTTSAAGFDFGTGDFTIEAFVSQTTPNSQWREIFMANAGYQINFMLFNKMLVIAREGVANDYSSSSGLAQGQMSHVAVSRNSGVVRGFIDGNKVFEGSYTHNFSSSAIHSLGARSNGVNGLVGAIDQFRVTKGVGRYTSNFIPQEFLNF